MPANPQWHNRPGQPVKLENLGIELSFEEIYERVTVPVKPELLM